MTLRTARGRSHTTRVKDQWKELMWLWNKEEIRLGHLTRFFKQPNKADYCGANQYVTIVVWMNRAPNAARYDELA